MHSKRRTTLIILLAIIAVACFVLRSTTVEEEIEYVLETGHLIKSGDKNTATPVTVTEGESYVEPTEAEPVKEVSTSTPVTENPSKFCKVGGCSSQLCLDANAEEMMTTCEYRAEYACYKQTKCEVQASGECGWTETEEFKGCIASSAQTEVVY